MICRRATKHFHILEITRKISIPWTNTISLIWAANLVMGYARPLSPPFNYTWTLHIGCLQLMNSKSIIVNITHWLSSNEVMIEHLLLRHSKLKKRILHNYSFHYSNINFMFNSWNLSFNVTNIYDIFQKYQSMLW